MTLVYDCMSYEVLCETATFSSLGTCEMVVMDFHSWPVSPCRFGAFVDRGSTATVPAKTQNFDNDRGDIGFSPKIGCSQLETGF